MFGRFRERSEELENLDRGSYTAEEYEGCLAELRRVNRWLGDAGALRRSVLEEIGREGGDGFSLLDVGAGSGELLRVAARWARGRGRRALHLRGRPRRHTLRAARRRAAAAPSSPTGR